MDRLLSSPPIHEPFPAMEDLTARLVQQTWAWLDGDTGQVLAWLQRLGCQILSRPEPGRTWHLQGIAGVNAALCFPTQPIDVAQAIGLLLAGALWPQAYPDFFRTVIAEWQRRHKQARNAASKERK